MEELLTPVSTAYKYEITENHKIEVQKAQEEPVIAVTKIISAEVALKVLKSKPDFVALRRTIKFLAESIGQEDDFNISTPSPIAAQIIHTLINDVVPDYWALLSQLAPASKHKYVHKQARQDLSTCLRNVTGVNTLLNRLKVLARSLDEKQKDGNSSINRAVVLQELLDLLGAILGPFSEPQFFTTLWRAVQIVTESLRRSLWRETLTLVVGSKILSFAAEAGSAANSASQEILEAPWFTKSSRYCDWIGRNMWYWLSQTATDDTVTSRYQVEMLSKALRLGSPEAVMKTLMEDSLSVPSAMSNLRLVILRSSQRDAETMLRISFMFLSGKMNSLKSSIASDDDTVLVGAAATYLQELSEHNAIAKDYMIFWLKASSSSDNAETILVYRAMVAVLATSTELLERLLNSSIEQFSDQLYIKHTPLSQQEAQAKVLLLSAGYMYRQSKVKLSMIMKRGPYLSSITHHLSASSSRVRFLGMLVGEVLSSLVDDENKRISFKQEELQSAEALQYRNLVNVQDKPAAMDKLVAKPKQQILVKEPSPRVTEIKPATKPKPKPRLQGISKIISIEEVVDDQPETEQEDMSAYAKPDSDEEDSDEDPTLIQRNKPTAPVYIRDLIAYLRDTEAYDKQKLGLNTAPSLIRRKTGFGTEVIEHIEELATLLVGLHDKFNLPNFQDARLQGMIAVILAQPKTMAPWFAKTFFNGDFSMAQRASVLTVLSVAARELAGYGEQDKALTALPQSANQFVSKQLPPKMRAIYGAKTFTQKDQKALSGQDLKPLSMNALDILTNSLSQAMVQPLAARAADTITGPDILKVRTFSSRLAVEAKRGAPTTNGLASILGSAFFFPLSARFASHLRSYGIGNVVFSPFLLSGFVKALNIMLHAGGPYAASIEDMISEYLTLLLSVRQQAESDQTVAEAVLLGVLTVLELSQARAMRDLVTRHGREVVEFQKWTDGYFARLPGGGEGSADNRIRSIAAAVLLKIGEMLQEYHTLLLGSMVR